MTKVTKIYQSSNGTLSAGNTVWGSVYNQTIYTNPTNVPQTIEGFSLEIDHAATAPTYLKYVLWVADTTSETIDWTTDANWSSYADKIWAYGCGQASTTLRYYDRAEPKTRRNLTQGQTIKLSTIGKGITAATSLYQIYISQFYAR